LLRRFLVLFLLFFSYLNASQWCYYSGYKIDNKTSYKVVLNNDEIRYYYYLGFLANDYDNISKNIKDIFVTDYKSKKFININKATFVVNSKTKSKFSSFSKLAFENVEDAKKHIKKYKGDIRNFDFVIYLASIDFENDKDIFNKKIQKDFKRGKKIFETICKDKLENLDLSNMISLKNSIKKSCKKLNEKNLQSLSIYLKYKDKIKIVKVEHIKVPQHSKCPVCGMIVYKYPKWAVKIEFHDKKIEFFDGAKDFFKYYFNPSKFFSKYKVEDIKNIYVTDFYTLKKIKAKNAFYVINSNVYGPMGHELIPFEDLQSAKKFKKDHFGKKILKFEEVKEKLVYDLDNL
jgi:copper chaperone NosL